MMDTQGTRPPIGLVAARLGIVGALVLADLLSKRAVFGWLSPRPEGLHYDGHGHARWLLAGDWLSFMLSWNPGMAWGITAIPAPLLVLGRCAAVAFLIWLVARAERGPRLFPTALMLILAGALGNLYDNLALAPDLMAGKFGMVRDFIDVYFPIWDYHFPTFNVADSCISVGAVLLLASSFLGPGRR